MTEKQAKTMARALRMRGLRGVGVEQTGGDVWIVYLTRGDDRHFIVMTDEIVSEWRTRRHFESGLPPIKRINLTGYGRSL